MSIDDLGDRKMRLSQILFGAARRRLTGKDGNKNFYKGRGVRNIGFPTKFGSYKVVPAKIQELVVPDLTDCELKPYVSKRTEESDSPGPVTGSSLLENIRANIDSIPHKEIP